MQRGDPTKALPPGSWAELRDADSTWNGAIRFQLRDREQALNLAVMLRSFAIVLGDLTTCLQVSSPYLPDWVTAFTHDPALGFRVARPKTTRT